MARSDWIGAARAALQQDGTAVLVTQCVVEGSAPREAGARILVREDGFWGTIGGGNLEHLVLEQARALLQRQELASLLQDYPLGPLLSQCCGGHVRILLERLSGADLDWLTELDSLISRSPGLVLETRLNGDGPRKRILPARAATANETAPFADRDGKPLPLARPPRDQCTFYREFLTPPLPSVHVFGAGHVGRAVLQVLSVSDFPLHWYDARPEYEGGTGAVPVEHLVSPDDAAAALPAGAICLVFTHAHELDYQLTRAILMRGDFLYCGLIGSRTKRARFTRRLAAEGLNEAGIARLTCPIGLPGIEGKSPFAIALSVAAQLNQLAPQSAPPAAAALE